MRSRSALGGLLCRFGPAALLLPILAICGGWGCDDDDDDPAVSSVLADPAEAWLLEGVGSFSDASAEGDAGTVTDPTELTMRKGSDVDGNIEGKSCGDAIELRPNGLEFDTEVGVREVIVQLPFSQDRVDSAGGTPQDLVAIQKDTTTGGLTLIEDVTIPAGEDVIRFPVDSFSTFQPFILLDPVADATGQWIVYPTDDVENLVPDDPEDPSLPLLDATQDGRAVTIVEPAEGNTLTGFAANNSYYVQGVIDESSGPDSSFKETLVVSFMLDSEGNDGIGDATVIVEMVEGEDTMTETFETEIRLVRVQEALFDATGDWNYVLGPDEGTVTVTQVANGATTVTIEVADGPTFEGYASDDQYIASGYEFEGDSEDPTEETFTVVVFTLEDTDDPADGVADAGSGTVYETTFEYVPFQRTETVTELSLTRVPAGP